MLRGPATSIALVLVTVCAAACDEPPPPPAADPGPASASPAAAPRAVARRPDEHPFLFTFREEMRMVLRPEQAARLAEVDTVGTRALDGRDLAFLVADRSLRTVVPLVLDAAGLAPDARRLRNLDAIEDHTGIRGARRLLARIVSSIEEELRRIVEEPPFAGRRALRAARLADEIAAPLTDEGAEVDLGPEDARRVGALFELSLEAYRDPEERAIVEPLAVQLLRDSAALARRPMEPPP